MGKYIVKLTEEEREFLKNLINTGRVSARKLVHARILLAADINEENPGKTDEEIAKILHISSRNVQRIRQRFVEEGIESALERKKHCCTKPRKLDGNQEAILIAKCCGEPPEGRSRWTLRLLADSLIQEEVVSSIAPETVRQVLKKKRTQAMA